MSHRPTGEPVHSPNDIDRIIEKMTLDQKVGQCMTLAFYGTELTDKVIERVETLHCGGLRITPHVTSAGRPDIVRRLAPYHTPGQYAATLNELQAIAAGRPLGLPLHMVTDQEGDFSVDILRGLALFPSQMGLTATGSAALARRCAREVARQLRSIGVHMIHSPVLDVNLNPRNPEIGCRSFSDSPQLCAEYGAAMMNGLSDGGIIATGKHFPGRGDSDEDAHYTLPVLKAPRERLDAVELFPYRQLIPNGLPAIMTAHNAYTALDASGTPASISRKIVTGLLRTELGFEGVVTTDSMGMEGLKAFCDEPEGCARAIAAGNDLVLVKECDDTPFEAHAAIKDAVRAGRIPEDRLNASVRRILLMKLRHGLFGNRYVEPEQADAVCGSASSAEAAREAAERCLTLVRDTNGLLPLSVQSRILVVLPIHPLYHEKGNDAGHSPDRLYHAIRARVPRPVLVEFAVPETDESIRHAVARSEPFDVVVACNLVWRGPATSHRTIRALADAGRRVAVVSNNIYDERFLPEAQTLLVTYSGMPAGMDAAAAGLFGELEPAGRSPLTE
ncbi:MAG: glycoside hydrolase family 3 N-terminal domain-containing protein, partial [Planctomycetota bacterium]